MKALIAAVAVLAVLALADPASATVPTVRSGFGAGYLSMPAGGVSSATARLVVPSVTCATNQDYEFLELGVFGYTDVGASTSFAELVVGCNKSFTPNYLAAASTPNGGSQPLSVAIGDTLVVKLVETDSSTTAIVNNLTQHTKARSTESRARDAAVLVGDFGKYAVPTFSTIHFGQSYVNGVNLANATPLTREVLKTGKNVQVSPSVMADNTAGFNLIFRNNT